MPAGLTTLLALRGGHLPGLHCPLRALTGVPCPTCYLTRATAAALRGKMAEAVQLHLFGPVVAGMLLIWSALAIRERRLRPFTLPPPLLLVTGLALLLYWLLRLIATYGLGLPGFPQLPP